MDRLSRMAFGIFVACAAFGGAALAADVSLAPGQSLTLGGVQFTPKGTLAPGAQPELDALGTYLADHPELSAQITASAPRKGGGKAVKAADRQAKAIRDYVVKQFKLDKRRVLARGQAADEEKIEVAALSAAGRPLAPEATLEATSGQVETKGPWESALRTPENSEKLYGGQALVTSPGATAEISFADGARVSIGAEADLSIGGGKAKGKASRDGITLSRGRATADLTGADRKAVLLVSTPAAELTLAGKGRGIVSVDSLNRTQVAVLAGSAIVSGKGKALVKAGFVVDVAKGVKPSKPRPLAAQPKLLKPFDEARVQGEVAFSWRSSAPRNRLEVSSAAAFASKAHESVVEGNAATVKLAEGTYFWRVTALDETGLESPPSDVKSFKVGAAAAVAAAGDEAKPAEDSALGLGLDLSSGDAAPKTEEAPPPLPIVVNTPAEQVDDPDLRQPAPKRKGPEEPLASRFHLGVALTPAAVFGLPNPYLAGDFELRASFAVMPFLHVMLAGGAGERTFLGAPLANGPRYAVLGTWHAGLGIQAPFGDGRQGPFAELVAGLRSFTAGASDLGYLTEVGRFEVLAGGGYRLRVADHRLDVGLRLGYAPGTRSAFGLQLLIGGWIF